MARQRSSSPINTYQIATRHGNGRDQSCKTCKVLNLSIPQAETSTRMGPLITNLKQKYGDDELADGHQRSLFRLWFTCSRRLVAPEGPPPSVSAGDGSESAYARIRDGQYQAATIPEPLNLHGWLAIDEMNRALAGEQPSYALHIYLVTKDNIAADGGPNNVRPRQWPLRQYKKIWESRVTSDRQRRRGDKVAIHPVTLSPFTLSPFLPTPTSPPPKRRPNAHRHPSTCFTS
jgi:ribose transport system substrate-binding protein